MFGFIPFTALDPQFILQDRTLTKVAVARDFDAVGCHDINLQVTNYLEDEKTEGAIFGPYLDPPPPPLVILHMSLLLYLDPNLTSTNVE